MGTAKHLNRYRPDQVKLKKGQHFEGGIGPIPLHDEIEAAWVIHSPEPGPLLIYLIRRFGYTTSGSDPLRELCAYRFSTPDPDVLLGISIKASRVAFSPLAESDLWDQVLNRNAASLDRVKQACVQTIQALGRSTSIRDLEFGPEGVRHRADRKGLILSTRHFHF